MAQPYARGKGRKAWRGIRTRLIGVLLIPTIAALVFGGLRLQDAVSQSARTARAESIAEILPDSFRLAVQLTAERDAAGPDVPARTVRQVQATTDALVRSWRGHLPQVDASDDRDLRENLSAAEADLDRLGVLRKQLTKRSTRDEAQQTYTRTLNVLLGLAAHLPALEDERIYGQTYALGRIRTASEALGSERVLMGRALATGRLSPDDRVTLAEAFTSWTSASSDFYEYASPAARSAFDTITHDTVPEGSVGAPMQAAVAKLVRTGDVDSLRMTLADWQGAYTDFVTKMVDVIVRAATDVADAVSASHDAARRSAILNGSLIILVLLVGLTGATLAARSILRPLGRLRRAALDIARSDLPRRVRALEQADGAVDVSVEPLGIAPHDEIGDVAQAFDAVHAEAVRLAGEQAQMRANVNKMFVNLSRRSQSLVERQLRLIDQLEATEQDPDDLANLFQLDHLATRMRRNDESLLVLAGGASGQAGRADVPVLDVLRAATAEIEQFARVEIDAREPGRLRGGVAGDLVHLLAELAENATNFSPPDTSVVVRTLRDGAGALAIEIRDEGLGMTGEELARANAKLQTDTGLDADVARMMGLVVASRLAHRHGLSVRLTANTPRGVVARVEVPATALVDEAPSSPQPELIGTISLQGFAPEPGPARASAGPAAPSPLPTRSPGAQGPASPASPPSRSWFAASARERDPESDPLEGATIEVTDDDSPIFAGLRSEWFTRRTPGAARPRPWSSPGDSGWRRAAEVREKSSVAVTTNGLPVRVPGEHLIPGTAGPAPQPRGADERRTRGLSSFQQGVSRARADTTSPAQHPDSEEQQ